MMKMKVFLITAFLISALSACGKGGNEPAGIQQNVVKVDFSQTEGKIGDVNGINNGPAINHVSTDEGIQWELDVTDYYRELDIPIVRTHDMEYPYGSDLFVDIHCIFPDFSRDVEDESAYQFAGTDDYIAHILECGAIPLFRLGESISDTAETALYTFPPEDFEKWADICEHIVRHYNDGWNNGFHYGLTYFEVWNEPDMKRQWTGDTELYYDLYRITARKLKETHPEIKIGGGVLASANEENMQQFLDGIVNDNQKTPLDFVSWHIYDADPAKFDWRARMVRTILDENGYEDTECILDEWNYMEDWNDPYPSFEYIQSWKAASYYGAALINMTYLPIDMACYYDGSLVNDIPWCALYQADGTKKPGYLAFKAFADMKRMGSKVSYPDYDAAKQLGVYILAACGNGAQGLLVCNRNESEVTFSLQANTERKTFTLTRVNEEAPMGAITEGELTGDDSFTLAPLEMFYLELR